MDGVPLRLDDGEQPPPAPPAPRRSRSAQPGGSADTALSDAQKKDRNQARVLALDLDTAAFCTLLADAWVTHGKMSAARKGNFKERPVVVQWDPERVMDPAAPPKEVMTRKTPEMRSIQIGERSGGTPSLPLPRSF